jgi:hypothetical protein
MVTVTLMVGVRVPLLLCYDIRSFSLSLFFPHFFSTGPAPVPAVGSFDPFQAAVIVSLKRCIEISRGGGGLMG